MSTLILYPTGAGDETFIPKQYPAADSHWDKVNEVVSDDGGRVVYSDAADSVYYRDLYDSTTDTTVLTGKVIDSVTVRIRAWRLNEKAKTALKTGGTVYDGAENTLTGGWVLYSTVYTTNPFYGGAWTKTQIDAMQFGVSVKSITLSSECTQSNVLVTYHQLFDDTITDGAKGGDTLATQCTFNPTITDGGKSGDTLPNIVNVTHTITDGAKSGDLASALINIVKTLTDGAKSGDAALYDYIIPLLITDGAKSGDTLATLLEAVQSIIDGAKSGDTPSINVDFRPTITDGAKSGDSTQIGKYYEHTITDGVKSGDIITYFIEYFATITDGAKSGDLVSLYLYAIIRLLILLSHQARLKLNVGSKARIILELRGGGE